MNAQINTANPTPTQWTPPAPLKLDREAWLTEAAGLIIDELISPLCDIPKRPYRISVGFPSGKVSKVIAQCWVSGASDDGTNEIFVSPAIDDSLEVLEAVVHELIHYTDDCESGHKGHFARVARQVGLVGKLTATKAGGGLVSSLQQYIALLGDIPHAKITPSKSGIKKQTTRMLKVSCNACDFMCRATQKNIDKIIYPDCPACESGVLAAQ